MASIDSGNGLVQNRHLVITWTNADQGIQWSMLLQGHLWRDTAYFSCIKWMIFHQLNTQTLYQTRDKDFYSIFKHFCSGKCIQMSPKFPTVCSTPKCFICDVLKNSRNAAMKVNNPLTPGRCGSNFNSSDAGDEIFQLCGVNTKPADALASNVARA